DSEREELHSTATDGDHDVARESVRWPTPLDIPSTALPASWVWLQLRASWCSWAGLLGSTPRTLPPRSRPLLPPLARGKAPASVSPSTPAKVRAPAHPPPCKFLL